MGAEKLRHKCTPGEHWNPLFLYVTHTHLNHNVPVAVSGFITNQMLFQGSWPVTWAWLNLLSSCWTGVWITLPDLNRGDTQDRSSLQRDCWKFLLWATLCHLAIKGSGNGGDLAVNMRHLPEAHWKWGLGRALQWQKLPRPSELHQQTTCIFCQNILFQTTL